MEKISNNLRFCVAVAVKRSTLDCPLSIWVVPQEDDELQGQDEEAFLNGDREEGEICWQESDWEEDTTEEKCFLCDCYLRLMQLRANGLGTRDKIAKVVAVECVSTRLIPALAFASVTLIIRYPISVSLLHLCFKDEGHFMQQFTELLLIRKSTLPICVHWFRLVSATVLFELVSYYITFELVQKLGIASYNEIFGPNSSLLTKLE
ncbi:hypothetical protein Prudu_021438 [Prunus dulcis]|uniref:Uncharacterized protein n=1 Tax=Prunus dulcis TaxID=3755 RepID=A0A4Y1RXC4_PRUDU|nr:hypothetical protein Prudu_021438 [Prunus dulcis]